MIDYALLSDSDLMRQLTTQDQYALAHLYERYGTSVYSIALRVLRQTTLAEEVTQDTFMKLWAQPHQWMAEKGSLKNWLLTIGRYTAIDRLRAEMRHSTHNSPLFDEMGIAAEDDSADELPLYDRRLLRTLISELPPDQGHLILLGFFQGLTHRQLAETLNLPLGTVKSRVRLGLQKLKLRWLESMRQNESL